MIIFGSLTGGVFLSSRSFSNLLRQMTIISFLAIGMTPVIITGNIGLSVGLMTGFISVIAAYLYLHFRPCGDHRLAHSALHARQSGSDSDFESWFEG